MIHWKYAFITLFFCMKTLQAAEDQRIFIKQENRDNIPMVVIYQGTTEMVAYPQAKVEKRPTTANSSQLSDSAMQTIYSMPNLAVELDFNNATTVVTSSKNDANTTSPQIEFIDLKAKSHLGEKLSRHYTPKKPRSKRLQKKTLPVRSQVMSIHNWLNPTTPLAQPLSTPVTQPATLAAARPIAPILHAGIPQPVMIQPIVTQVYMSQPALAPLYLQQTPTVVNPYASNPYIMLQPDRLPTGNNVRHVQQGHVNGTKPK